MVVSIILPVYNRELLLPRAIESVMGQTFLDWNLFIVDDCSKDRSINVAESYGDSRIKVLKTSSNEGAAAARNLGIRESDSEFVCFLDSDDAYEPNFLMETVQKFRSLKINVGMVWTGLRIIKGEGELRQVSDQIWKPNIRNAYQHFLAELRIGTNSGITIRREVFEIVGLFDESLPAAEDTDLFLRISKVYEVDYIDKVLINIYQSGEDRLSKRFDKIALAYNQIIPKHITAIEVDKKLRLKFFYKAMWLNFHLGDKKLARHYFSKVLVDNPVFLKAWYIFITFELFGKVIGAKLHLLMAKG